MDNYHHLLNEATQKLIDLSHEPEISPELLGKAPPVLWFGNNLTSKDKIVTIGANPSREEFLSENKFKAQDRLSQLGGLRYLSGHLSRFKTLDETQDWAHILKEEKLREEVIKSYNQYFNQNPYKWFGKKATASEYAYNVEGFINALDASYYEGDKKFQGLHIDLMPFPTISDFSSLLVASEKHIFKNDWANLFLEKLITEMHPKMILVFGRTNLNYLTRFLEISNIGPTHTFKALTENGQMSTANYWSFQYKHFPVIGLSTNLGNPKGFSKKTLNAFGKVVAGVCKLE